MTIKSVPFVSKRGNMLAHGIKKQKNSIDGENPILSAISQTRMMKKDHVDTCFIDFYDKAAINL